MSYFYFANGNAARVLTLNGITKSVILSGVSLPQGVLAILPDNAQIGVNEVKKNMNIGDDEGESFKNFLIDNGFE